MPNLVLCARHQFNISGRTILMTEKDSQRTQPHMGTDSSALNVALQSQKLFDHTAHNKTKQRDARHGDVLPPSGQSWEK